MKKIIPVFVVLLILVCGGSFYGGMQYANSQRAATMAAGRAGGGNFRGGATGTFAGGRGGIGARGGMGFASGEILSKDDASITIKLRDGGSQIVFFSSSTAIMKAVSGSVADLLVGKTVVVNGTPNSDGSVTARNIQLALTSTLR